MEDALLQSVIEQSLADVTESDTVHVDDHGRLYCMCAGLKCAVLVHNCDVIYIDIIQG